MGKSSVGKDTVLEELLKDEELNIKTIVPYTTRPMRQYEVNGKEYLFTTEETFQQLKSTNKVIVDTSYETQKGLWRYYIADDMQLHIRNQHYITICTPEAYESLLNYFGSEKLIPILLTIDEGERIQRALDREKTQQHPDYKELCRRMLADNEAFSKEKLEKLGISIKFENNSIADCIKSIKEYLVGQLN
jgi:guanylate kinase